MNATFFNTREQIFFCEDEMIDYQIREITMIANYLEYTNSEIDDYTYHVYSNKVIPYRELKEKFKCYNVEQTKS